MPPWGNSAKLAKRQYDEAIYDAVAREIDAGQVRPGLWAKVFSEVGGDRDKAQALYIEKRAETIALEAKVRHDQQLRQQHELQKEQQRLVRLAQSEQEQLEKEAREAEQARKNEEDRRALVIFALSVGVPGVLAWEVFELTQSSTLGIFYAVLLLTIPLLWVTASRRTSHRYTAAVVAGALFIALAKWIWGVETGAGLFVAGAIFVAVSFVLLNFVRKVNARPSTESSK